MGIGAEKEDRIVQANELFRAVEDGPARSPQELRVLSRARPAPPGLLESREQPLAHEAARERTASTAESVGSISIGRLARAGAGSVSWW